MEHMKGKTLMMRLMIWHHWAVRWQALHHCQYQVQLPHYQCLLHSPLNKGDKRTQNLETVFKNRGVLLSLHLKRLTSLLTRTLADLMRIPEEKKQQQVVQGKAGADVTEEDMVTISVDEAKDQEGEEITGLLKEGEDVAAKATPLHSAAILP
mmetsp:Transcript_8046/g.15559  ORF Transcript_8046/g.15559 Transcript_8046/m.15559 type:complete len:152 (+) Transcript_8046:1-456(+)